MDKKEKIVRGFKLALNAIAGFGITLLCSAFAGSVASSSSSGLIKKTCMAIGGSVVGAMVAKQAESYVNGEVDAVVRNIEEVVAFINDTKEEG